ncbi:MAG: RidA family protein, partial [Legionellales bacterium]|nr:RidA family protein [Legionellales bacterium]
RNLQAVCREAGGDLQQLVKLTVFLTDMNDFPHFNEVMMEFFQPPYPARSTVAVKQLPKNVKIEIEGILILD